MNLLLIRSHQPKQAEGVLNMLVSVTHFSAWHCVEYQDLLTVLIIVSGMLILRFFRYFWPDPFSADPFSVFFPKLFRLSKVKIDNARHRRIVPLTRPPPSAFSYFIFLFLSLFVLIFCETARTRRFSVIFEKVQWHPCCMKNIFSVVKNCLSADCLQISPV